MNRSRSDAWDWESYIQGSMGELRNYSSPIRLVWENRLTYRLPGHTCRVTHGPSSDGCRPRDRSCEKGRPALARVEWLGAAGVLLILFGMQHPTQEKKVSKDS